MKSNPNFNSLLSDKEDVHLRKAMNIVYAYCIAVHLVLLAGFYKLGIKEMVIANLFSPFLYALAIYYSSSKRKIVAGASFAIFEASVHGLVSIIYVGWNSNFHLYVILVYLLIFFLFRVKLWYRIVLAVLITMPYVLLYTWSVNNPSAYALPHRFIITAGVVNIINMVFVLSVFALTYIHLIRKNITLLEEANKQHRQLDAQKNKFFSIFSHDLKSPINSLYAFLELMIDRYDTLDDEKRKHFLNQMYTATGDTYKLVNNLLEWSKSQLNNIKLNPVEFNVYEIINEAITLIKPHADSKNIVIVENIKGSPTVYADRQSLQTIVRNLVSNAVKFTPQGGRVKIGVSQTEEFTRIVVSDNGTGITEKRKKELFSLEKEELVLGTADERGTGLGLIVVKEFVEKNKGEFSFSSEPDVGSVFTIQFMSQEQQNA